MRPLLRRRHAARLEASFVSCVMCYVLIFRLRTRASSCRFLLSSQLYVVHLALEGSGHDYIDVGHLV